MSNVRKGFQTNQLCSSIMYTQSKMSESITMMVLRFEAVCLRFFFISKHLLPMFVNIDIGSPTQTQKRMCMCSSRARMSVFGIRMMMMSFELVFCWRFSLIERFEMNMQFDTKSSLVLSCVKIFNQISINQKNHFIRRKLHDYLIA